MLDWIWKRAPSAEEARVHLLHPVAPTAPRPTPELSDEDLRDVVGGLERIYVEGRKSQSLQSTH